MIFLLGPTASGKSAIALRMAERLPIEIISVDSAQVYRGLDIGTAKPTPAERARVPHHLIDIIEPTEAYSAARFASDASRLCRDIETLGHIPLLVGGTMLYAKALIEGLHDLPGADQAIRAAIEEEARSLGWPALHAQLSMIDPVTAARLAPRDAQRIQRALEIYRTTGKSMSAWLADAQRERPRPDPIQPTPVVIALEPGERAVLHERIAQRFEAMITHGLIDEVRALRERADLRADCPAIRSVGYRQVWAWLDDGAQAPIRSMIESGIAATRQLAKRQLTWLRGMPDRLIVDCLAPDCLAQVEERVIQAWSSLQSNHQK